MSREIERSNSGSYSYHTTICPATRRGACTQRRFCTKQLACDALCTYGGTTNSHGTTACAKEQYLLKAVESQVQAGISIMPIPDVPC